MQRLSDLLPEFVRRRLFVESLSIVLISAGAENVCEGILFHSFIVAARLTCITLNYNQAFGGDLNHTIVIGTES